MTPPQNPPQPDSADDRQAYASTLVDDLRAHGHKLRAGRVTLHTAKSFGFCWGVDKAVEIVHDAVEAHPGKRIWMLDQMIHNPAVNRDLLARGIRFVKGTYAEGDGFEAISSGDVAIIPAFSAQVEDIQRLKDIGCVIVDTTCPWVLKPHLRTQRNIEAGFTTVIHATMGHAETRSTCSLIRHHGGHFLVVKDLEQTDILCAFLRREIGAAALMAELGEFATPEFDPDADLDRVALINQTTMLASESREIGRRIESAVLERVGTDALREHFRDFDTICNATQDNQDAVEALVDGTPLDLMIVVGGFESSNTRNLARITRDKVATYHVEDAAFLQPDAIRHLPEQGTEPVRTADWLPATGNLVVGFSAGASTPDTKLAEAMRRLVSLAGESTDSLVASR